MTRTSVHQQSSSLRILALCLATLLIPGGDVFASSGGKDSHKKQDPQVNAAVAARFLEQASWGPTAGTIADVQAAGLQPYITQQVSAPISTYPTPTAGQDVSVLQNQFFINAMTGQDQLRQRVSFALSQIMVVSASSFKDPSAMSLWMNMMQNDALGNFFTLLNDVTLSPTMGTFLNMANNNGCAVRCRPNENYGREVLQLFTVGLVQLNLDGTPTLDGSGNQIPTYGQDTISGFGKLFSGWSYPPAPGKTPHFFNGPYYSGPMLPYPMHYSKASKTLLNGTVIQPNGDIQADLTAGLQNIFNHPNVGPFISQQLIQKLVTSNPSPAYVTRVAQVFNDNGSGVRGDLLAVVSAILLDPEARRGDDPTQDLPSDGHLREPLLHIMFALRSANATTDGAGLVGYAGPMLQPPLSPPSVFNFYPPNYQIPGTTLLGPEFKILNSTTSMSRINFINDLIYGSVGPNTHTDISPYVAAAADVNGLLDMLSANLLHNAMSTDMRSTLSTTLSAIPDNTRRAQAGLYLVASSSQFQVAH